MSLPDDPAQAMAAWRGAVNGAVTEWHRARGCDFPDLNDLDRRKVIDAIGFCFPHYFLLPQYSSASSYRIRPLGPEQTLFEVWSLTRYPNDRLPGQTDPARTAGARRSQLADDSRAGLLESSASAERSARQGIRIHAIVESDRRSDLQLRARHRRLPGRPAVRAAWCPRFRRRTPPSTCPSPTSGFRRRPLHGELG